MLGFASAPRSRCALAYGSGQLTGIPLLVSIETGQRTESFLYSFLLQSDIMTLKMIVGAGIIYAGLLGLASIGTQKVDGYLVRKTIVGQTILSPAPGYSNAVLVDEDSDGLLDRKYATVASRQGLFTHDLPITEQDRRVFSDITSKL